MHSSARAAINRENAAHSTGPATPDGKRRASLNALRHGLTGQTVVLPSDDLAAYQVSCAEFFTEFKPEGLLERRLVQTIADTYWRLDRIRTMENNLFSLGFHEQSAEIAVDDPRIACALAQAKSLDQRADLLTRLSLYEQRLNRTLAQAIADLKQLQQDRAEARRHSLYEAENIRKLKQAQNQNWRPEDDGFDFSSVELTAWTTRRRLLDDARTFQHHGRLPES